MQEADPDTLRYRIWHIPPASPATPGSGPLKIMVRAGQADAGRAQRSEPVRTQAPRAAPRPQTDTTPETGQRHNQ
jgi:hypothetical protein